MIIINVIFCLAFLWFAWLNLNDTDSWLWVPIYLFAALCCGAAVFGYYFPIAYLVAIAFYLVYAVILFFAKDGVRDWITKYRAQNIAATMQATKPWIEKTREFFGLLIISGALLINYLVYTS
ncbi:transmembrane 220 family protein [Compostibacter hankyongensis]|uniref:Transmembrane family 220 protein n=1 Tax=Compostibacter hankyongensis TaxID=1007089 RepID=A0ABP8FIB1_9BACT